MALGLFTMFSRRSRRRYEVSWEASAATMSAPLREVPTRIFPFSGTKGAEKCAFPISIPHLG
jgi:hypothetical protein